MQPRPVRHIFMDRFGERVGFLKHHAHAFAKIGDIDRRIENIHVVKKDVPLISGSLDEIIQAIHAAEQGGLPATGRSDEGGHLMFENIQINLEEGLDRPVEKIEALHAKLRLPLSAGPMRHVGIMRVHALHLQ
ncbi:hypothetical protein COMA2_20406 [Candidatus Nitrospira nitrificans]|uniref:Uncharacterized protein n=1 Tax=Candidatus Nitrospira nitrificans TaxID=1742973 RepID=A0A0S4LGM3_9BACT|nr:hypothetical protein COMA2_20406 [Candidatus Nitrospira nitrificans]